jgi:SEC-C motif-containing protein
MDICPCGSKLDYGSCCGPIIKGDLPAVTAEQLMRSRYSAYVKKEISYIFTSLHADFRSDYDEKSSRSWAEQAEWHGIKILKTVKGGAEDDEGEVEFSVSYTENGFKQEHHELSSFKKEKGIWFFTTGKTMPKPVSRALPKTGRNDPCTCGSGKKFKKCCGQ